MPADCNSVAALLRQGEQILRQSGIDSARLDAALLMMQLTGLSKAGLIAHDDMQLSADTAAAFFSLISRRAAGEPEAYLTGHREFWSFDLKVNPHVLIPRPDTEVLVEAALAFDFTDVVDLGTGSGAVILALKKERPHCRACAVDISAPAMQTAQENARALGLEVEFLQGSWFAPLEGRLFDLIVSNPPYIAAGDPHLQQNGLNFEPQQALVSGPDGFADIREIVQQAPSFLRPGGVLMFEHGWTQHENAALLLRRRGFTDIVGIKDYSGRVRVTRGRFTQN